jgi:hypothetical protein
MDITLHMNDIVRIAKELEDRGMKSRNQDTKMFCCLMANKLRNEIEKALKPVDMREKKK